MIFEPQAEQNDLFKGSPVVPPGIVKTAIWPVIFTSSAGNAIADKNAVPVCFWQSTQ